MHSLILWLIVPTQGISIHFCWLLFFLQCFIIAIRHYFLPFFDDQKKNQPNKKMFKNSSAFRRASAINRIWSKHYYSIRECLHILDLNHILTLEFKSFEVKSWILILPISVDMGQSRGHLFEKTWFITQGCFVPRLVEIVPPPLPPTHLWF